MGYYCIDNLPVSLVESLVTRLKSTEGLKRVAVSVDARNLADDLANFSETINSLPIEQLQIVYLDAASQTLVKRFSETRRKHPLSDENRDLKAALELETELLDTISSHADLTIDTTSLTLHELRDLCEKSHHRKPSGARSAVSVIRVQEWRTGGCRHGIRRSLSAEPSLGT